MNNIKQNFLLILLAGILILLGILVFQPTSRQLSGVSKFLDTSSNLISPSTSSVGGAVVQVFSSITKMGEIINDTTGKLTCEMEATGVTSTITAGAGIIIVPSASSTSNLPNVVRFGECSGVGNIPCYAHKGAVNCISTPTATISYWSK